MIYGFIVFTSSQELEDSEVMSLDAETTSFKFSDKINESFDIRKQLVVILYLAMYEFILLKISSKFISLKISSKFISRNISSLLLYLLKKNVY